MTNDAVGSITENSDDIVTGWIGEVTKLYAAQYIDFYLLLIFGGIPWQCYWQRALSAKSVFVAQVLSYVAAVGCLAMAVPAVLLGAVAKMTDWSQTDYGQYFILYEERSMTLPLVLKHLTPTAVRIIGLGAVSAAVMSSTDSAMLSSSSMFAKNVFNVIYARIHKTQPSETVQVWVMRIAQVAIAVSAAVMAIEIGSIYELFLLCADFVYVIMYPQFVCIMFLKGTNAYGSLVAFIVGLFFRMTGGDNTLHIPALIKYPWYQDFDDSQLFPFRTMSMLISFFTLIFVSYLTDFLFRRQILPQKCDIYGCFDHLTLRKNVVKPQNGDNDVQVIGSSSSTNPLPEAWS